MRLRKSALGMLLAFAISVLIAAPAAADTITVDKRGDKPDPKPNNGKCEVNKGKKKGNNKGKKKGKQSKCSLRAAIQTANSTSGSDRLILTQKNYKLSVQGTGEDNAATGDLDVTSGSDITIRGGDNSINAKNVDRVFDVLAGGSLTVNTATVFNGAPAATESGGAFRNAGTLVIDRSAIGGNVVTVTAPRRRHLQRWRRPEGHRHPDRLQPGGSRRWRDRDERWHGCHRRLEAEQQRCGSDPR